MPTHQMRPHDPSLPGPATHEVIEIPRSDVLESALTGLHFEAIDTDVESHTALALSTLHQRGLRLIALSPYVTKQGRRANLIVTQDLPKEEGGLDRAGA